MSRLRNYLVNRKPLLMQALLLLMVGLATGRVAIAVVHQWHDGPFRISSVTGGMPEADYSLLWAAGRMAAAGQATDLYDGPRFARAREQLFGPGLQQLDWIYPPPTIMVGIAVSQIPLLPGYFLWLCLLCGGSIWALRGAGLSWPVVLFGLFGPPTWRALLLGQYSPLAASLVVAGLLQARRRPFRAGIALTLATFKPQLGLLAPIVLLARGNWTALFVAIAGTLALAIMSTAWLGIGIWPAFLHGSSSSGRTLLYSFFPGGDQFHAASVFWMARSFGASIVLSYAAQALAAGMAAAAVVAAARHRTESAAVAVAACLTLLVSPYLYTSDFVAYSIAVAMLAERAPLRLLPWFLWLCPGLSDVVVRLTGMQVLPLCVVVAATLAWRDLDAAPRPLDATERVAWLPWWRLPRQPRAGRRGRGERAGSDNALAKVQDGGGAGADCGGLPASRHQQR